MAGDQQPITSNEYGNKLLNGEGLLHLVGTIKTEISNAGGGGATYTAGRGIKIDANNEISSYPVDPTTGLLMSLIGQNTGSDEFSVNLRTLINKTPKADFISAIKDGKIISMVGNVYWSGLGTDLYEMGFKNVLVLNDNGTKTVIDLSIQANWKPSRNYTYWASNNLIIGVLENYGGAFGRGISNNLYYNNANSGLAATTIKGAIDELNTNKQDALPAITNNQSKVLAVNSNATGLEWVEQSDGGSSLPADPAADGTYFLSTTVSSGTATQSWVSIPAAAGNNF